MTQYNIDDLTEQFEAWQGIGQERNRIEHAAISELYGDTEFKVKRDIYWAEDGHDYGPGVGVTHAGGTVELLSKDGIIKRKRQIVIVPADLHSVDIFEYGSSFDDNDFKHGKFVYGGEVWTVIASLSSHHRV